MPNDSRTPPNLPRRLAIWAGRACMIAALTGTTVPATAQSEVPQPGDTLTVATLYTTLSPLSWDPADWSWKLNHDAGQVYEVLFSADLSKAVHRGGTQRFVIDGWLPPETVRGELAESWALKDDPLRAEVRLRRGVMFPDKPGVMAARELTADDVVASFERFNRSPKRIREQFEHIDRVEAIDRHTVVFRFDRFDAMWQARFGWGAFSAIVPPEVERAGAGNWRNVNGTGPFMLTDVVAGSHTTYTRNPDYWDHELLGGQRHRLPFVDKLVYRTLRDESTQHAALRTAKIDILESVRWSAVDELKRSAPALQWSRRLSTLGQYVALRTDVKPLDDPRVRRALNIAIDKRQIVEAYYGGQAELFAYPMHPEFQGYFEPLAAMPPSVRELFTHDLAKAKALLAQAGVPDGFVLKVQVCACDPDHMDLLPLLAAQLEKIGVRVEAQTMAYPAFLSAMTTRTNAAGYLARGGHLSPLVGLRRAFQSDSIFNPAMYANPDFDRRIVAAFEERDESRRQAEVRALTREIVDAAPYIWLPTPYAFMAWWPWVRNYGGELAAGFNRPGPIYARIWIDQKMKRSLGF